MLAGTKADVRKLNMLSRQALVAAGCLHSEMTMTTEAGDRTFGVGERILFTRNNKILGVRNGQLGTMEGWRVLPGNGAMEISVRLDGGEVIRFDPAEYSHVDHGYAISTHKAQGVTCDQVNVLLSDSMTDQEWSYVAMSRHRQRLRVFVPEGMEEDLSLALGRSRQKELASDYAVATEPTSKRSSRAHEIEPAC